MVKPAVMTDQCGAPVDGGPGALGATWGRTGGAGGREQGDGWTGSGLHSFFGAGSHPAAMRGA